MTSLAHTRCIHLARPKPAAVKELGHRQATTGAGEIAKSHPARIDVHAFLGQGARKATIARLRLGLATGPAIMAILRRSWATIRCLTADVHPDLVVH